MEKGNDLFVTCRPPLPDYKGPSTLWLSLLPGTGLEFIDSELGLLDLRFSRQPKNPYSSNSTHSSVTHVTPGSSQARVSLWKVEIVNTWVSCAHWSHMRHPREALPDHAWCHCSL